MIARWAWLLLPVTSLSCTPSGDLAIPPGGLDVPTPRQLSAGTIPADGRFHSIPGLLMSIGHLAAKDEATIVIRSASPPDVFILDDSGSITDEAGAVSRLVFVADVESEYFVLLQSTASLSELDSVSLAIRPGQELPPRMPQVIRLNFDGAASVNIPGFESLGDGQVLTQLPPMDLTAIGDTAEEKVFLGELQPLVESMIVDRLNAIFCQYGITVGTGSDFAGAEGVSTVHFTNRVGPPSDNLFDTVQDSASCSGEDCSLIFYGIAALDLGNRIPDDEAVVFVGSFIHEPGLQTSVGDMVNILSHCAAHEIGHLLGLQHVFRRSDIMWGRPNNAFTRDIDFGRAQVVFDDDLLIEFLYQDPDRYLSRISGLSHDPVCASQPE